MIDYIREGDEPLEFEGNCQDLGTLFRNRLTDCLTLANYTVPQEFLIETLCFHLHAGSVSSRDAKSDLGSDRLDRETSNEDGLSSPVTADLKFDTFSGMIRYQNITSS